jgi:hypothetical protein
MKPVDPKRPTETIIKEGRTATGGEKFVIRRQDGTTETVITTPSSTAAIKKAVETYSPALRSLAKK